jgi:hypothetical protein
MNNNSKRMKDTPKIWNETEVKLLKKWGEQASSYRILHNKAYRKYKYLTALYTIPVIIISTLTGTANFSQGTIIQIYPSSELYLPLVIGALNLISGIITTIGQFLRVSELNEANRNASISYGKFARNITTELSLPPNERTYSGLDFIQICRNEMDRLIEQSPEIPMKIINTFEQSKKFEKIIKPELINISQINAYVPTSEEKAKEIVAGAAGKFRQSYLKNKLIEINPDVYTNNKIDNKKNIEIELADLKNKRVANNSMIRKRVSTIFSRSKSKSNDDMYDTLNSFQVNKLINDQIENQIKDSTNNNLNINSTDNNFTTNIDNEELTNKNIINNDNNRENTITDIHNVKDLFENMSNNEIMKPPLKKITSIKELVKNDNLNKLDNIKNKNHTIVDVINLKSKLLHKIDETKENINNNLNSSIDINEIETNLDEINDSIINNSKKLITENNDNNVGSIENNDINNHNNHNNINTNNNMNTKNDITNNDITNNDITNNDITNNDILDETDEEN